MLNLPNWKFYQITFLETREGKMVKSDRFFAYSSDGPMSTNEMKDKIKKALKRPSSVIVILHNLELTPEEFRLYAGFEPWNDNIRHIPG